MFELLGNKRIAFFLQLIKSDLDGTISAIETKLDERALLRKKKVCAFYSSPLSNHMYLLNN